MPDIVTRGTKGSELSFQEGDEQIAETQLAVTGPLSIDENHNRQHLVITTGTGAISLDTASALDAALDITHTGAVKIGWIVKISNNSGSANTINLTTGTDTLNGVVGGSFSLADNDSVIISFDNVSLTKGYNLIGEYIGTLPIARGGTGATTLTDGGILLGSGTGAITAMAVLADGEMIVGDGTTDPVPESGATLRTSIGVGTADSPQFTAVNIGHATNTTLSQPSAGDLQIETNIIYRAGGTDVPVADGGTGRSSHTAYGVIIGGTTATNPQASVAVGTANQVLTSNGPGAAPSMKPSSYSVVLTGANFTSNSFATPGNTLYASFIGDKAGSAVSSTSVRSVCPYSGTIKDFWIRAGSNTLSVDCDVTMLINGVAASITTTVTIGSEASFSDLVNTESISAGDLLELRSVCAAGSGLISTISWGITIT